MYRSLNNELRRVKERAKQEWWENECNEMEELGRRGLTDVLYSRISRHSENSQRGGGKRAIKDSNGVLLSEPKDIQRRRKEYVETLYDKNGKPTDEDIRVESIDQVDKEEIWPGLLTEEITRAIQDMKQQKSSRN